MEAAMPSTMTPLRPPARHFGTTSVPARHHWVLDTFMVLAAVVVFVLLFV
jgi:hypothetical protein